MELQSLKQRFDIIGTDALLDRALEIAVQVANTDLSVLVTGESGVGKEVVPQIIHAYSSRKHGTYIAVNCGAIPEGTIDSELFGHEKGAFTGANDTRKGYFETADKGTIFLDEVAELPLTTQVRLLRVLQTGEFMKVGSSKVQKTNVRVVAATNVNLSYAIRAGKFREDLYYRLNTVPIVLPALRERPMDIHILFRKFAADFAEKYKMPTIKLTEQAVNVLVQYRWPGNIRQLKNVVEQISILESQRVIQPEILHKYLPVENADNLPVATTSGSAQSQDWINERNILYKMIFQLKNEVENLKTQFGRLHLDKPSEDVVTSLTPSNTPSHQVSRLSEEADNADIVEVGLEDDKTDISEDLLSISDLNAELIKKCLLKHNGKRKPAAEELGISERTLYRRIKELNIK
ncbi:MAG: sigma-54 dependent transcriptional regulator [Bacteroidia bacterium]|nr:sigma-54 dependent transcriptional regulator [Bacteroidia bacterium]